MDSQSLIKELIELRALKREKDSFKDTHTKLLIQISNFEVNISELNTILELKDEEIHKLKQSYSSAMSQNRELLQKNHDLEEKIMLKALENNNKSQDTVFQLQMNLEQEKHLKATYEQKFKEATKRLIELKNSNLSVNEAHLTIETMKKELETKDKEIKNLKFYYENEIKTRDNELQELKMMYERSVDVPYHNLINSPKKPKNELAKSVTQLPTRRQERNESSRLKKPPSLQPDSKKNSITLSSPRNPSLMSTTTSSTAASNRYMPSFLRKKTNNFEHL